MNWWSGGGSNSREVTYGSYPVPLVAPATRPVKRRRPRERGRFALGGGRGFTATYCSAALRSALCGARSLVEQRFLVTGDQPLAPARSVRTEHDVGRRDCPGLDAIVEG